MKRYCSLAGYRKGTHRTQAEIAAEFGVSVKLVSAWERGRRQPKLDVALRIHEKTGVPLEALVKPGRAVNVGA